VIIMATRTKRPKKAKLRGGTNQPAEPIEMPSVDPVTTATDEAVAPAAAVEEYPSLPSDVELLPGAETNGHVGTIADAVDLVVERAEEHKPVNRLTEALAYDSPERLAEWDAETVLKVNESARECAAYRADHEAKAEVAKDAKKAYELAVADHFKLVDQRKAGRGQPVQQELFDRTQGHAAAEADLREPGEVPSPADDSWKVVPLISLVENDGLPAKVAQLLGDAGIHLMGELAAHTEPKASGWTDKLTDIAGIGPAKVEQIDAATAAFWARWKPHADATRPEDAPTGQQPGDGDGAGAVDSGDGGDGAAQAEPEPAGYHTEGTERIAKRKRKAK
jgi:hypothetical protein